MPLIKNLDKKYTYDDYKTWSDDERWEIIRGIAYKAESSVKLTPDCPPAPPKINKNNRKSENLNSIISNTSPAPKVKHQRISRKMSETLFANIDKLKGCEYFTAPTDVVFDEYNIVQPDIFVICDKSKITEDNIKGAPDLVIEIVSKFTELKDRREKLKLYERFGVKEYIIIFPEREYLERYSLENNKYSAPEIFNWDEVLKLKMFDIEINLWDIFEKKVESEKDET